MSQEVMKIPLEITNENVIKSENSQNIQYVYGDEQMVLGSADDISNIGEIVLEDGTRAMIINGTLHTADGQVLILQDNNDLSQYYVDENMDHVFLSKEQEDQFLGMISSQNSQTGEQIVQYVQDTENNSHIPGENEQIVYIQEGNQEIPIQDQYEISGEVSENINLPMQMVRLQNQNIEEIDGVIDLDQFLNQPQLVELEGGNYQYAILKDGKFHVQTFNEPNANVLREDEYVDLTEEIILDGSTGLNYLDTTNIQGRNISTGQPITLSKYMKKIYNRNNKIEDNKLKYQDKYTDSNSADNSSQILKKLLNKKITIGKTDNGKLLVGKIVNVTKKTDLTSSSRNNKNRLIRSSNTRVLEQNIPVSNDSKKTMSDVTSKKVIQKNPNVKSITNDSCSLRVPVKPSVAEIFENYQTNLTYTSTSPSLQVEENSSNILLETNSSTAPSDVVLETNQTLNAGRVSASSNYENQQSDKSVNSEPSVEQSKILVHKKFVGKESFDAITRTLTGLMSMDSVVRKLKNKTIIIKILEKKYDHDLGDYSKSVSYCTGYMVREYKMNEEAHSVEESWKFIPDSNSQDTILGEDNLMISLQEGSGGKILKKIANLTIQITISPEGSRTTRVIINPPNMYKCKNCPKTFRTNGALKIHLNDAHPLTRSSDECKAHISIHQMDDSEKIYECMECNKRFCSSLTLKKHAEMHFRPVICRYCNQGFTNMRDLKNHLPIHECAAGSPEPNESNVTKIKSHEDVSPSKKARLEFTDSEISPNSETKDVTSEMTTAPKRTEQKIYCCHICGKQFSRHSNLQRHVEIHRGDGAMYKCSICNCSYHYVSSLTRHIVTCHVDTKNKRLKQAENQNIQETNSSDQNYQFISEDQMVEMIQLVSSENLQYVTETMENVTGDLCISEGVEILQIPVDKNNIIIENHAFR